MCLEQTVEKHIEDTALLFVTHLKNILQLRHETGQNFSFHSQIFEQLFYPQEVLLYRGQSELVYQEPETGRYKQHLVPKIVLMNAVWDCLEQQQYSEQDIAYMLKGNLGMVDVSLDEMHLLDRRLKCHMPDGWSLVDVQPWARFDHLGIQVVNRQGQPLNQAASPIWS